MNAITVYPADFHRIYQTDPELSSRPQIKHGGCFFVSIVMALALNFRIPLVHSSLIAFYDKELADNDADVNNEMFVADPQNLIDDFIGAGKVLYLGRKSADYEAKPCDILWGCWHRDGADFDHFTHGSARPVAHDPWRNADGSGSASVSEGKLIGQRVARIL